jgi:hypothetical protein
MEVHLCLYVEGAYVEVEGPEVPEEVAHVCSTIEMQPESVVPASCQIQPALQVQKRHP